MFPIYVGAGLPANAAHQAPVVLDVPPPSQASQLPHFNEVLKTQPYVAGDAFSVADITVYTALIHGTYAGLNVPADHTALLEWQARVTERPSVKNRSGQDLLPEDLPHLAPLMAYLNS